MSVFDRYRAAHRDRGIRSTDVAKRAQARAASFKQIAFRATGDNRASRRRDAAITRRAR